MSKTPTILKKDDSQQRVRNQPIQPKILTKSSAKENVHSAIIQKKVEDGQTPQPMKSCRRMMFPNLQLDQKIFDHLDSDNTDFLVVGIIGQQNVGKSVLANIIASEKYLQIDDETESVKFLKQHEVFPTAGVVYEGKSTNAFSAVLSIDFVLGNTIDMFITLDRIIVLDTSPLLANVQRRDMMVSECDDLKMLMILLQLCHLVLVVHDGFPDMQIVRLVKVADQMIPNNMSHRPIYYYVGNRLQPGTKIMEMDPRLHEGVNLTVPNLHHHGVFMHHDVYQVIQDLQERVFMSARRSMLDLDEEVFTEKVWKERLISVMEQMKNDYFLRKYEALRDKFHQPIE